MVKNQECDRGPTVGRLAVNQTYARFDSCRSPHLACVAEWSSPVARRVHTPKVVGANPTSATESKC